MNILTLNRLLSVKHWFTKFTIGTGSEIEVVEVPTRGPTYKVDIIVDSVKTRELLDHGAKVSIVRRELLPKV